MGRWPSERAPASEPENTGFLDAPASSPHWRPLFHGTRTRLPPDGPPVRAAVLRSGELFVRDDVPEPVPALGQGLGQVKACGICGSDLHFAKHGAKMLALASQMDGLEQLGPDEELDLDRDVYMGHEF